MLILSDCSAQKVIALRSGKEAVESSYLIQSWRSGSYDTAVQISVEKKIFVGAFFSVSEMEKAFDRVCYE